MLRESRISSVVSRVNEPSSFVCSHAFIMLLQPDMKNKPANNQTALTTLRRTLRVHMIMKLSRIFTGNQDGTLLQRQLTAYYRHILTKALNPWTGATPGILLRSPFRDLTCGSTNRHNYYFAWRARRVRPCSTILDPQCHLPIQATASIAPWAMH